MGYFYSKKLKAFYHDAVQERKTMPKDAKPITDAEHALLLSQMNGTSEETPDDIKVVIAQPIPPVQVDLGPSIKQLEDEAYNAKVQAELDDIDRKKIRAITDALLTGDTVKLEGLELHAAALRKQFRKV